MDEKRADIRGTVGGGVFEDGEKETMTSVIMLGVRMDAEQKVCF